MKDSIRFRLEQSRDRFEELAGLLADPDVISEQNKFRDLSREYARLEPIVQLFGRYDAVGEDLSAAEEMAGDADEAVREMGQEELGSLQKLQEQLLEDLQKSLIPADPYDDANIYLEIRAGTGGDEAAIFAGDLFRMYTRYAESRGWQVEAVSERDGEHGGYKEVVARVSGTGIYAHLKFESGAHRVQRVPATESQGRIHTSACTVAVLPEPDEVEEVDINPSDLRIDTYRASGAGGQHVNKTDSAVRVTHLPSGIVVECQDERSQHKNMAIAMRMLKAKLWEIEEQRRLAERHALEGGNTSRAGHAERTRRDQYEVGTFRVDRRVP